MMTTSIFDISQTTNGVETTNSNNGGNNEVVLPNKRRNIQKID